MANNSIKEYALTNGRQRLMVDGSFTTSGTSAVSIVGGRGFGVTRSTTGTYVVSLSSVYPSLVALNYDVLSVTTVNANFIQQCSTFNVTTSQFTLWNTSNTATASTAVLTDCLYGSVVTFQAVFMNSSSTK